MDSFYLSRLPRIGSCRVARLWTTPPSRELRSWPHERVNASSAIPHQHTPHGSVQAGTDSFERESPSPYCATETAELHVNDLSDILRVSPETIRRDLRRLQQRGLLRRVHGGAVLCQEVRARPYLERVDD
ncbi:DeoR family transcriptional regulator [Sinorhizobium sp. 7-81]|uniref:DeoR family transcriptional regulator n=1 Tax=Sinorhizobium sp. 8-89 TaxID=3049089 RepID=UPI0024C43425|nr:DeoR family transcriptional regulator [Sinorhizobium sp. 8-89]MDK1492911.1 DeoR family transcriptional regulator [Sinorhizobium sp. 8-89]